jgi:calcineurin-like phosphoesterase family protein
VTLATEPRDGRILLAGDWHGSFPQADKAIRYAYEQGISTIVHLGDFGIWSNDKPYLNSMQFLLKQWEIDLFFIDGNHEDFPRLYAKKTVEDGTRPIRDNITHLPRGMRWEWGGLIFLALGGAASIDKGYRRENVSWWSEEYLTEEDILTAQSGGKVDVMFTHDSPSSAPNSITGDPIGQLGAIKYYGADMINYCNNHRKLLQRVTDEVTPRLLFHGHYHMFMEGVYVHNDENNTVGYVTGLDQGTGAIGKSTYILDLEEAKNRIEELNNIEY